MPSSVPICLFATSQISTQAAQKIRAPGLTKTSEYVLPWTFRTAALSRLRAAHVKEVRGWGNMSVSQLHAAFPDQGQWLTKLETHVRCKRYEKGKKCEKRFGRVTVDTLVRFLKFKLPVELFSMCLCFSGDSQMQQCSASTLAALSNNIQVKSKEYDAEHGQWPHLVVALALAQSPEPNCI
jgi:hypothetical protein